MQLVAYGAQDIYLTGNPQITFFKVVYRRHTNFSIESIRQTFNGNENFGGDVSATISRNGDLVHRIYLEHSAKFEHNTSGVGRDVGLCERYGDSLIKECEIEIGGQKIDKYDSMWSRIWSDLTQVNDDGYETATGTGKLTSGTLYNMMSGNTVGFNTADASMDDLGMGGAGTVTASGITYTNSAGDGITHASVDIGKIYIPLHFWFCRNAGLALPLIALQYHEVKVKMTFEDQTKLVRTSPDDTATQFISASTDTSAYEVKDLQFNLWCDYIYLDTDERRRFAQVSHEYLIEQIQEFQTNIESQNQSIAINFNHPVKELVWVTRNETSGAVKGRCQALGTTGDPTASPVSIDTFGGEWMLKLNGHDRFKERDSKYFTRTQIWQHHTGYGSIPTLSEGEADLTAESNPITVGFDAIGVYSFALKPEEHQPSGTCNFSRIDNAQLVCKNMTTRNVGDQSSPAYAEASVASGDNITINIYAVNYNVLRIMSGMGGLAYSN